MDSWILLACNENVLDFIVLQMILEYADNDAIADEERMVGVHIE